MRKSLVACVAVVLVLAGLLALILPPPSPVSRVDFERLEVGMTREEVHAAIGVGPGEYHAGPSWGDPIYLEKSWAKCDEWRTPEGRFVAYYNPIMGWKLTGKWFEPAKRPAPVEVARWRLGTLGQTLLP